VAPPHRQTEKQSLNAEAQKALPETKKRALARLTDDIQFSKHSLKPRRTPPRRSGRKKLSKPALAQAADKTKTSECQTKQPAFLKTWRLKNKFSA